MQSRTFCTAPPSDRQPALSAMFEEDFERCFICQEPCKGLYCSSECRIQDKGALAPAVPPQRGPIRLTAQLPPHLSPHARPPISIGPSPKMPPHVPSRHLTGGSSSSSSTTSSPIQSPLTNPSGYDSPNKETFNLPPPAHLPPHQSLALPGSIPVKIPALIPRVSGSLSPQGETPVPHSSTVYPTAGSIDTLRFGRKPGVTNSVTSPNALLPRCSCGKPVNHKDRPSSKERAAMNSDLSHLHLGPALSTLPETYNGQSFRVVSDPINPPTRNRIQTDYPHSGLASPRQSFNSNPPPNGGSLLSRSRSDPIPPSPKGRPNAIAPMPTREMSIITPNRRASVVGNPTQPAVPLTDSPRRGRSRDRLRHMPTLESSNRVLNQSAEREQAPSRSRHRRDERFRSDERRQADRERAREVVAQQDVEATLITPSWSRHTSFSEAQQVPGGGMAPPIRRQMSGGRVSPPREEKRGDDSNAAVEKGRKEELRRASKQLGQVYGVAAG